ncbi:DUF4142 domain-containing protein [Paludisphaera sp.]|uniref:DUF4142 domain-containing protein n=1 Tax=Paludisphaera sp. TaxID=2017432 RepID=UPI00301DB69B
MIRRWMLAGAALLFAASPVPAQSDAGAGGQAGERAGGQAGERRAGAQIGDRRVGGVAGDRAEAGAARSPVDDALFAAAAAESGALEVAMSRLGAEKATDPELKRFGQMMVDEHTKLNEELATTAAAKNIELPREVGACARFKLQSLSGLSGAEFDKCFAEAQLVAHKEAKAIFEAQAERGQDPEVKALAAKGLQHIQRHLETIKPIAMRYDDSGHSGRAGAADHHDDAGRGQPGQPGQQRRPGESRTSDDQGQGGESSQRRPGGSQPGGDSGQSGQSATPR